MGLFNFAEMAENKEVKAKKPRNYVLGGSGVMRFSQSRMYKKHGVKFIKNKATKEKKRGPKAMVIKKIKGDNNGGKRVVRVKRMPRNYPTAEPQECFLSTQAQTPPINHSWNSSHSSLWQTQ